MARVVIVELDHYPFSTEIDVTINLINSANHVANENIIALMNEARVRYSKQLGLDKQADGVSYINADLAVSYKSEAHYGDRLKIEVGAADANKYGCDFVFRITRTSDGRLIALSKMAMLAFDYQKSQVCAPSTNFWQALGLEQA